MNKGNMPANSLYRASFALVATLLSLLGPGIPAGAQSFTLLNDTSETVTMNVTENGNAATPTYSNVYVGRYKASVNGGPAENVWCVDLTHSINLGGSYTANTAFDVTSTAGTLHNSYYQGGLSSVLTNGDYTTVSAAAATLRSDETAYLIDTYLNANVATLTASGDKNVKDNLVALQLSLWDIVQDGGDGLGSGSMRVDAAAQNTYGTLVGYYENVASQHANYTSTTATWVQAPATGIGLHAQDFAATSVPEPGSFAMLTGFSVVGAGFAVRTRIRRR